MTAFVFGIGSSGEVKKLEGTACEMPIALLYAQTLLKQGQGDDKDRWCDGRKVVVIGARDR